MHEKQLCLPGVRLSAGAWEGDEVRRACCRGEIGTRVSKRDESFREDEAEKVM